ncbi:type II toxin-antitoxin system Phd/YefM family antitoxin [Rhodococcoides kyotonense]|uniref:Antitoxin n=1 Tax=Rhodococcoides kyotonense TaxID=398843 RepID=A0A239IK09_9NOCA|nr:type II toxin-antitoxin system prevent-host-death family antitoxin [Rhodococcus kyotonensis]SNS93879.1 prevent-host-death family protein [Rhodococcus kyotonensis]
MDTIGLKELRQHASDYVKRAEAGETLLITVAGRPSAVLGPTARKQWQSFSDIADVFESASDPTLSDDLHGVDDDVQDPWER